DVNTNGNTVERISVDLDGKARRAADPAVADSGVGIAPFIDRGAYEFAYALGDMNCDQSTTTLDISHFITALLDPNLYNSSHPFCSILNGDMNGDGLVDGADVQPFVSCVVGGNCP